MSALTVETVAADQQHQLLLLTEPTNPLVWLRDDYGMVGIGTLVRLEFSGPNRIQQAAAAWRQIAEAAHINDPFEKPGTGLLAFGSFAFSGTSAETSVLIIPRIIVGHHKDIAWITRIHPTEHTNDAPAPVNVTPLQSEYHLPLHPGSLPPHAYKKAVSKAIHHIHEGDLEKVVLARDLVGHAPPGGDVRHTLAALAQKYPNCWTFAVDGLIGSSPETLVRVRHGSVDARVLAGTTSRGTDAHSDREQAITLAQSHKEKDEHAFAVQSVAEALRPHTSSLANSDVPFTLQLPNLWHLATDFEGQLSDGSTSLDLVNALHPTAAVAGTPTNNALELIDQLEPFDRGRYAGPIGWVGADGDGEWAVALRCAEIKENGQITAYAGAGIVAESDPERELNETSMKFSPVVDALE